jgi:hypothetical protein
MSRFLVCLFALFVSVAAAEPKPLDVNGLLKLKSAGFSDDVLIAAVKSADDVNFDTSPDGLLALKSAGLSERLVMAILERVGPAVVAKAPPPKATLLAGEEEITLAPATLMAAFASKDAKFDQKVKESGGSLATESEKAKAAKDAHKSSGSALSRVPWGRIASSTTGNPDAGRSSGKGVSKPVRAREFFYLEGKQPPEVSGRLLFRLPSTYGDVRLDDYEPVLYKLTVFEAEQARVAETRDVLLVPLSDPSSTSAPGVQTLATYHRERRLELRRDSAGVTITLAEDITSGPYALLLKEISGDGFAALAFEIRLK